MSQMFKQYLYAWLRLRCLWAISYLFHYLCLYLPRVFVKRTSKYILLNVLVCSIAQYFTSHASCKEKISVSHDWSNPSSSDFTRNRILVLRISRGIETQMFEFHKELNTSSSDFKMESNPRPSDFTRNRNPDLPISRGIESRTFGFQEEPNSRYLDFTGKRTPDLRMVALGWSTASEYEIERFRVRFLLRRFLFIGFLHGCE